MTEAEAQEIVDLIRAATADSRVNPQTLAYFQASLTPLKFDFALTAARTGTDLTWKKFPSWSEFKEAYALQLRLAEPTGEQRIVQEQEKERRKYDKRENPPEWVFVWSWCVLKQGRTGLKFFPQQEVADESQVMSMEEYEKLRDEWKAAGSPKSDNPIMMAR